MKAKKILLILTGGTICSFTTVNGEQASDTQKAQALILENFRKSNSRYRSESCVQFTSVSPLDVLSENMTVSHWDILLRAMKSYAYSDYDGVIILHGTDTLAYTAALLSLVLAGLKIPVIMVSSQLALYNPNANGNENFKVAVELIVNGIKPNVYAVYRNENELGQKTMYVHYAAHLLQCANHSNNFYSRDMTPIDSENAVFDGMESLGENPIFQKEQFDLCTARVLKLQPYVGLNYSAISLDGIHAVVHGTYHSGTVATDPHLDHSDCADYSIMHFKRLCDNHVPPIPLFIEPYEQTTYETTGDALRNGILPIENLTSEMAYVKVLVGCALGYRENALYEYLQTNVNNEFLNERISKD